jgi:anti-sigma factor RsiW
MSRDPRDRRDDEAESALLTAYVDGVAELSPDERHRVEDQLARDPQARADADAVKSLLDQLRALPPSYEGGSEPDWAAMERSIRHAVAAEPPRPWWRSWRWLVPAMTCATATAVLILIWPRTQAVLPERPPAVRPHAPALSEPTPGDSVVALWLDGAEVDVDLSAPDVASELFGAVPGTPPGELGETGEPGEPSETGETDEVGLLPATDLAWVDHLDAAALDRAEHWLSRKKG